MSLKDALQTERASGIYRGPSCAVCVLTSELPKDESAALAAALAEATMTHAAISRALRAEGYAIRANTVSRHRKGECRGR